MTYRRRLIGLALVTVLAFTACTPNPITWITNVVTSFPAVDNAAKPPELREVSCAVVLYDNEINSAGKTTFTPIDGYGQFFPEQWYWQCFGQHPPGSQYRTAVPTQKATGVQNDSTLPTSAQCLVTTWPPSALLRFDCFFPDPNIRFQRSDKVFMQVASA